MPTCVEHVGACEALEAELEDLYVDAGAGLYCDATHHDDSEIADYVAALGAGPADVLDVGAGDGRLSLPILRAGHRVTCLDLSSAMLERLAARLEAQPAAAGRARLVHGSMLEYVEPGAYSHVLLGTANYSLLVRPDLRAAFLGLARDNLAGDGRLLLGFVDTDPQLAPPLQARLAPGVWFSETLDVPAQTRTITMRRGRLRFTSTTRLLRAESVVAELRAAGFAEPTVLAATPIDAGRTHLVVTAAVASSGAAAAANATAAVIAPAAADRATPYDPIRQEQTA